MLDEKAKRKPNFDERNSAPVGLADGQSWFVPKPWLEIRPTFRGGRAVGSYPTLSYGPELDGLLGAIGDCTDSLAQIVAVASLAAHLLTQQYDLADADLDELLCFRTRDEVSPQWMHQIVHIATGTSGPKAWSAGGD